MQKLVFLAQNQEYLQKENTINDETASNHDLIVLFLVTSERLFLEKKNELFSFENAQSLTCEYCMTILTGKFNYILLKLLYNILCIKFDEFS